MRYQESEGARRPATSRATAFPRTLCGLGADPLGRPEVDSPVNVDDLRALHVSMPRGSAITLSRRAIGDLLDHLAPAATQRGEVRDLTLPEVAERVGRASSTVRAWCNTGLMAGAYKLNGRDWRVPPAALDAFLRGQGEDSSGTRRGVGAPRDLSDWRAEYRAGMNSTREK